MCVHSIFACLVTRRSSENPHQREGRQERDLPLARDQHLDPDGRVLSVLRRENRLSKTSKADTSLIWAQSLNGKEIFELMHGLFLCKRVFVRLLVQHSDGELLAFGGDPCRGAHACQCPGRSTSQTILLLLRRSKSHHGDVCEGP